MRRPAWLLGGPPGATLLLVAVALVPGWHLVTAQAAEAQGFGLYQQSACAMALGGAVVARPCDDGSAVFFNPGALAGSEGWKASVGTAVIASDGRFTSDRTRTGTDMEPDPSVIPHFFVHHGTSDRLALGLGVYSPYGFSSEWPQDFEGAFISFRSSLESLYVQPTASYQVSDRISVGAGVVAAFSRVELNRTVDLSQESVPGTGVTWGQLGIPRGTAFASVGLESDWGTGWGGHFGIQAQVNDRIDLGLRFLTPVNMNYDGAATFRQLETGLVIPGQNPLGVPAGTPVDALVEDAFDDGPLVDQEGRTGITFPAQVVGGARYELSPELALSLDLHWFNWSTFDQVELRFADPALDDVLEQNYEDAWAIRVGGRYRLAPDWALGLGYIHNTAASPPESMTPLVPEGDRNHFTAGLGWQATSRVAVHGTYHRLVQNDRRGRTQPAPDGQAPTTDLNNGLYEVDAHLFGLTLTLEF